jgi:hypothetical protein
MESSTFDAPTKLHFVDSSGSDVGAVFADRVLRREEEVEFYFGCVCVAILGKKYLKLGSRQLEGSFRTLESLLLRTRSRKESGD